MATTSLVTTVILIRHAERNNPTAANPDLRLNTAGKARAKKLIHVIGQSGIKAIYNSHFVRSRETARPLAAHLGLSPIVMDEPPQITSDILSNHTGQTVLVIGHSDTIPDLITRLGAGSIPAIDDSEFDNLFIVKVFGQESASVSRLKYGNPSAIG
ncbi:MAG TPA: phosphoglycerate mutase family protein [Candidatus Binatia bacterium]